MNDPTLRRWWYDHNLKVALAIASLRMAYLEGQKKRSARRRIVMIVCACLLLLFALAAMSILACGLGYTLCLVLLNLLKGYH